jgi:hypothetical protein
MLAPSAATNRHHPKRNPARRKIDTTAAALPLPHASARPPHAFTARYSRRLLLLLRRRRMTMMLARMEDSQAAAAAGGARRVIGMEGGRARFEPRFGTVLLVLLGVPSPCKAATAAAQNKQGV